MAKFASSNCYHMNWQIIDFRLKQSSVNKARKSISILLTILVGTQANHGQLEFCSQMEQSKPK